MREMSMKEKVVIFGSEGHAKVLIEVIERQGEYSICSVVDLNPTKNHLGVYGIISEEKFFTDPSCKKGFVAIGDNFTRSKVVNKIVAKIPEFKFISAIHPSAQLGNNISIGQGTCVMANATINSDSILGSHVIVNTNSSIDHDCKLDDYASIAPNSALGGGCHVGKFSAISIGANVIHGLKVGENTVIGAGATLVRNADSHGVYLGTPARRFKTRSLGQKYL